MNNSFLILISIILAVSAIIISIIRVIPEQFIYDFYIIIILVIAICIIIIFLYIFRNQIKRIFLNIFQYIANLFQNIDFKHSSIPSKYKKFFIQGYKQVKQLTKISGSSQVISLIVSEYGMEDYISATYPNPLSLKKKIEGETIKWKFFNECILIDFKTDSDKNIKDLVNSLKWFWKKKYIKLANCSIILSIEVNFTNNDVSSSQKYIKRLSSFIGMLKQNKVKDISIFLLITIKYSSNGIKEIFDSLSANQQKMPLGVFYPSSEDKKPDVFIENAIYLLKKDFSDFRLYYIHKENNINNDILNLPNHFYELKVKGKLNEIVAEVFEDTHLNGVLFTFKF